MLKITEINDNLISVLDTSDSSVDTVTKEDVIHCVRDLGLDIFGVVSHRDGSYSFHIAHELYEKSRIKLHLYRDFELTCSSDDTLMFCKYNGDLTQDFSILLESYVSGCMACCFRSFCRPVNPDIKITLIFTDNLNLDPLVLDDLQVHNALYDLTRLSDSTANKIYERLIKQGTVFDTEPLLQSSVIRDTKERFYYYKLLYYSYKLRGSQDGKFDKLLYDKSLSEYRNTWIDRMIKEHIDVWTNILNAALHWYGEPTQLDDISLKMAEAKLHTLCTSRFSSKYLNLLYSLMCSHIMPKSLVYTICRINIRPYGLRIR